MSRVGLLFAPFACALAVVGAPVVAQASTLYVPTTSPGVATIDTATNTLGASLPFPGGRPWAVVFSPNGATAYVLDNTLATVTPVSVATGTLGTPITIPGGKTPEDIAITPNGNTAYVANVNGETVVPINLATDTPGTPITLPANSAPFSVAVAPDGATAYVADYGTGSVTPISTATDTAGTPIKVAGGATGAQYIAITPNGETAYVTNSLTDSVTPINLATNTAGTPITLPNGSAPYSVAITPDGSTAYVADRGTGFVTPINTATNTAGTPISIGVGSAPQGLTITPDGRTLYVANNLAGTVTPISTATNTAGAPILDVPAPGLPAIVPDQGPSAAFTATASGTSVSFNASGSSASGGSVASYAWSFGDGTTATSSVPTITHAYATAGNYTATLTVTDNDGCSTAVIFTGHSVSCNGSNAAQTAHTIATEVVASKPPVISGTTTVGQSLRTSTGAWTGPSPISFSYQWERCSSTCSAIGGATHSSYTLTSADLGAKIAVVVTAANSAGSVAASSSQVGPVAPSSAQVKAALSKLLKPSGKAATLKAIVKARGFSFSFTAPSAGSLVIDWFTTVKRKQVLVASASVSFHRAGRATVTLKLTGKGRTLLTTGKSIKVATKATFTPTGHTPTTSTSTTTLKP